MAPTFLLWLLSIVAVLTAFFISLFTCFRKFQPFYLRLIPFYHLLRLVTEGAIFLCLLKGSPLPTGYLLSRNLLAITELLFFSVFFFLQISQGIFLISYLAITVICVAFLLFPTGGGSLAGLCSSTTLLVLHVHLIGSCLIYYMDLFCLPHPSFSQSPPFWIAAGFFISAIVGMPLLITAMRGYFIPISVSLNISGAGCFILHLAYIKAYTCKLPKFLSLN